MVRREGIQTRFSQSNRDKNKVNQQLTIHYPVMRNERHGMPRIQVAFVLFFVRALQGVLLAFHKIAN